ncbi:hypothetical protein [Rufibacter soli]
MIWLLAAQALALFLAYSYTEGEIGEDHAQIQADGSKDTLKERFHAANAWEMAGVLMGLASSSVLALLLDGSYLHAILLACAFFLFTWAWYGFRFTQGLNLARGLDRWYVSKDPRAAKTDRTMQALATRFHLAPEEVNRRVFTYWLGLTGLGYVGVLGYILIVNLTP